MNADVEARSRITSILDLLEHELQALAVLEQPRLDGVIRDGNQLRAEIVAALASLPRPQPNGRGSPDR